MLRIVKNISVLNNFLMNFLTLEKLGSRRGCNSMVVGFTTISSISAYHHKGCEFEPRSWRGVLDTTLCDKVFQ